MDAKVWGMMIWNCSRLLIWTRAQKSQILVQKVKLAITCWLEFHENYNGSKVWGSWLGGWGDEIGCN
jgi:hypothetical protein